MKEAILEITSFCFLGLGFFVSEKPILSFLCFLIFALLGLVCISLEDEKERKMFRK